MAAKKKTVTIKLEGELSINNADEIKKQMINSLDKAEETIILDVSKLEDLDVPIIQLIFSLASEASNKEIKLEITGSIEKKVKKRLCDCGLIPNENTVDSIVHDYMKTKMGVSS